jgi:hypothetical protein
MLNPLPATVASGLRSIDILEVSDGYNFIVAGVKQKKEATCASFSEG